MHAINQSTANDLHHQVINAISAILYTRRRRIWWMTGSAHWYAILLSCSASRLPEYWNRKPGVRVLGRFRRNVHRITWTMHESLQAVVAETDNDANRSDDFSRARRAFVVRNVGSVGRRRVREHNEGLPCRDVCSIQTTAGCANQLRLLVREGSGDPNTTFIHYCFRPALFLNLRKQVKPISHIKRRPAPHSRVLPPGIIPTTSAVHCESLLILDW